MAYTSFFKPFDFLIECKGKNIIIELKNSKSVEGKLITFDLNGNFLLEINDETAFYRGDNILSVRKADSNMKGGDKNGKSNN